jgi:hypothetical protein
MIEPHPYPGYKPKEVKGCLPQVIAVIIIVFIIIGIAIFRH